jgi:hypothetical protein
MRRCAWSLALCGAAILLFAQQCCALRAPKQITLDANGCQGLQWNALVSCMAVQSQPAQTPTTLQPYCAFPPRVANSVAQGASPSTALVQGDKFGYSVNFDLHPMAASCNPGHVRVSKLYVQVNRSLIRYCLFVTTASVMCALLMAGLCSILGAQHMDCGRDFGSVHVWCRG